MKDVYFMLQRDRELSAIGQMDRALYSNIGTGWDSPGNGQEKNWQKYQELKEAIIEPMRLSTWANYIDKVKNDDIASK